MLKAAGEGRPSSAYLRPDGSGLLWGPLTEARLLRRYKRFLADVELADGRRLTAHTPNTGRMTGCSEPGRRVWLSRHDTPGRKYAYTLEMIEMPAALVGINTGVPNRLVAQALRCGAVPGLPPGLVRGEVTRGRSRLDLSLTPEAGPEILIEIKNCTLAENGRAYFPDAVTQRGSRHLAELARLAGEGVRTVIFILVQRADGLVFSPADHIDPEWGRQLRAALAAGTELMVHQARLDLAGVWLGAHLPVIL